MMNSTTNKSASDLLNMWKSLCSPAGDTRAGRSVIRVDENSPLTLLLARFFPSNDFAFLVDEMGPDDMPSDFQMRRSRGLVIRVEKSNRSGHRGGMLVVELLENDCLDIFAKLVEDILLELFHCNSHRQAFRTVFLVINRWRRFFSLAGSGELTDKQQLGLFGELWLLRELANRGLLIDRLISGWTGPSGGNQDLNLGPSAVEIKAVSANRDDLVEISNLRQLDTTGLKQLFLAQLVFDSRSDAGESLLSIIEVIRNIVADDNSGLSIVFSEKLEEAGYNPTHDELYNRIGYSLRSMSFFRVGDGFPRITEGRVSSGITEASYQISIDACRLFEITVEILIVDLMEKNG
jgi:hypothetical protein